MEQNELVVRQNRELRLAVPGYELWVEREWICAASGIDIATVLDSVNDDRMARDLKKNPVIADSQLGRRGRVRGVVGSSGPIPSELTALNVAVILSIACLTNDNPREEYLNWITVGLNRTLPVLLAS